MHASCETCGNTYDKAFTVLEHDGTRHVFDCFECAIEAVAPRCAHCGCRVIGHGRELDGRIFCCAHCAREGADEHTLATVGASSMTDDERVDEDGRESFPASDPPAHY